MTINQLYSDYLLDNLELYKVHELAVELLETKFESEPLLILAGLNDQDTVYDKEELLKAVFIDQGFEVPERDFDNEELIKFYFHRALDESIEIERGIGFLVGKRAFDDYLDQQEELKFIYGEYIGLEDLRYSNNNWSDTLTNEEIRLNMLKNIREQIQQWLSKNEHNINFESDFWDENYYNHPVLTNDTLIKAQELLGIKLPVEYIKLLRIQNGGYIKGFKFGVDFQNSWSDDHIPLEHLYGIVLDNSIDTAFNVMDSDYLTKEWGLPDHQIIIAGEGHYWVTLDYSSSENPIVKWIDVEMGENIKLADSFSEFLTKLYS